MCAGLFCIRNQKDRQRYRRTAHMTAGEEFTGTATFSTIPMGYAVNSHKLYHEDDVPLTPVLGTVTYKLRCAPDALMGDGLFLR